MVLLGGITHGVVHAPKRGHEHRWNVRLDIGSVGAALILTSAAEVDVMNLTNQKTGSLKVRRRILSYLTEYNVVYLAILSWDKVKCESLVLTIECMKLTSTVYRDNCKSTPVSAHFRPE